MVFSISSSTLQAVRPLSLSAKHTAAYDQRDVKLVPLSDVLHSLITAVFTGVPAGARILCVGTGTGHKLIYLVQKFP